MDEKIEHIEESLKKSFSYTEYEMLISDLLKQGKSTTKNGSDDLVKYSELNLHRMQRWDKTFQVKPELQKTIKAFQEKRIWLVISESWCGDAAHSVPIINKVAELNKNIDLHIVLREENEMLMQDFLTNGGKSIPKLIVYNPETKEVENTWGPRPKEATTLFNTYKDGDFETLKENLQKWYNADKGESVTEELTRLLN